MRLVGAVPAPATTHGVECLYVVYDAKAWGFTDIERYARPLLFYGVVQQDGDDAPGRLIPMVEDPESYGNHFKLVPLFEVPSALAVVPGTSAQDAIDEAMVVLGV